MILEEQDGDAIPRPQDTQERKMSNEEVREKLREISKIRSNPDRTIDDVEYAHHLKTEIFWQHIEPEVQAHLAALIHSV